MASALIAWVMVPNNAEQFLAWIRATTGEPSMTLRDLLEDLTAARETLKDMGYVWP